MGGCLASFMVRQSLSREVPDRRIEDRLAYGPLAVLSPSDDASSSDPLRSGVYRSAEPSAVPHVSPEEPFMRRLERTFAAFAARRAVAYRRVREVETASRVDSTGRAVRWTVTHLCAPSHRTYGELWGAAMALGVGLRSLGAADGARVVLYCETRWEWVATALAAWAQRAVVATVYANLGESALRHALDETRAAVVFCAGAAVPTLLAIRARGGWAGGRIVYVDELPDSVPPGTDGLHRWTETQTAQTAKLGEVGEVGDLALVMYTSGTTAQPKGVMHTFASLAAGADALHHRLRDLTGPPEEGETYVAYLPLAHILEFICEIIMLQRGALICYGSPRTLTDASACPRGDLTEFRPMLFVGVPRIFETIRKTVEARLLPGTWRRKVFDAAYKHRLEAIRAGKDTPYLNTKVFGVARGMLGGRMRGIVCGGSPLGDRTQEFMNVVFGVPMAQGYGLTESCCCASVQRTGELYPVAGQLLPSVELRLLDTEEYKHTDTPEPRGEILLRGPFLFKGYYKQENLTAEALDKDGWFHTGDVGSMDEEGCLRIVGRVKALAKNVLGEYIAMEALEAIYGQHPLVGTSICVLVHPQRAYICALVLTDEAKAMTFAALHKIGGSWPNVLDDASFHTRAAESLTAWAKSEKRSPFEFLRHVRVLAEEWTPENGLLTASMKIRRSAVDKSYAKVIEELFARD